MKLLKVGRIKNDKQILNLKLSILFSLIEDIEWEKKTYSDQKAIKLEFKKL